MTKFRVVMMIEMMGKPKEHLTESLIKLVENLGSETGVKIINKNINEPKKIEQSQTLFSSFAEIEAEFESIENLFGIVFAYMPSYIEIISPEKFTITNAHLSDIVNRLTERLHNYDSITKGLYFENNELAKKLKEYVPELFTSKEEAQKEENDKTKKAKTQNSKKN